MTRTRSGVPKVFDRVLPGMLAGMVVFASLPAFLTGAVLQAQSPPAIDARFQPWIGCWRTIGTTDMSQPLSVPTQACVVPSTQVVGSVDVLLYARDSLLSRSALPRAGEVTDKTIDDCQGRETAEWTSDNARFLMRAELTCAQGMRRVETGMMTITPQGEWLQLQHMQVGSSQATTTVRFRYAAEAPAPAGVEFGTMRSTPSLRMVTGAPVTVEQVLQVATRAPAGLSEAWIAELGMPFELNGRTLARLADSGMPSPVIDMMVAVSNPQRFAVRTGATASPRSTAADLKAVAPSVDAMRTVPYVPCGALDDFCYGPRGMGAWGFGWQYASAAWDPWNPWFGFASRQYGNRYPLPGGYPYGLPYPGSWGGGIYYGGGPIIVVNPPSGSQARPQGRLIKGQGYTRSGGADVGGAAPRRTTTDDAGRSGSSGGAGSIPAPSSGSESGSGSSSGRTAQPRPPVKF